MDDDDSDEEAATSVMDSPLLAMGWQAAPQRPAAPAHPPLGLGGTMMMPAPQQVPAPQPAATPAPQLAPTPQALPPAAEAPELPTMPLAPGGGPPPGPWQPTPTAAGAPPGAPPPAASAGIAWPEAMTAPVPPTPPMLQPASIPPRRSATLLILGALLVFAGGGAAAYLLLGRRPPAAAPEVVASATVAPMPSASAIEAAAASSAGASASASASASAAASAAAPPPVGDPEACVASLFAPETFDAADGTKLSAVCDETDPRKGSVTLKAEAIRAGSSGSVKKVSDGMREWAILGWYEMAAFSVIRARCCPAAAPITLPTPEGCEPLDKVLTELGAAASTAGDDAAARDVLARYTKAAHCVARSGAATRYGRGDRIEGGEETAFLKTLDRVRASTKP